MNLTLHSYFSSKYYFTLQEESEGLKDDKSASDFAEALFYQLTVVLRLADQQTGIYVDIIILTIGAS